MDLEAAAGDPVIPGDVEKWLLAVADRLAGVQPALAERLAEHAAMYEQILASESVAPIEQMREQDRELQATLATCADRTERLATALSADSSDEPVEPAEALREDLVQWVSRARAHAREVDGWLTDATWRETGSAD